MTYDWAKPGVKVVCVDAEASFGLLAEDQIYIIRETMIQEVGVFKGVATHNAVILRFNGMKDRYTFSSGNYMTGFNVRRFKPLVSKDLPASLTNLLKNPKSVILPNEGNRWDVKKQPEKIR